MSGWSYLFLGIVFEIAGTFCMKLSDGFKQTIPSILFVGFFMVALVMISFAVKTLPIGVAYAVWSGVGIVGITTLGYFFLGENISGIQLLFIALIVVGVVGLNQWE